MKTTLVKMLADCFQAQGGEHAAVVTLGVVIHACMQFTILPEIKVDLLNIDVMQFGLGYMYPLCHRIIVP